MNRQKEYQEQYHVFSAQAIRITLFVYVYVRLLTEETCVLDIFLNPLFFFLDGMALKIEENESLFHFLYRKFRTFIIPYFFFAFLLVILDTLLLPIEGMPMTYDYFLKSLTGIFVNSRVYSLWYLPSLFFAETIVYLIHRIGKDNLLLESGLSLFVLSLSLLYNRFLHIYLPLSMDTSFIGSFYLYLGYLFTNPKLKKARDRFFQGRIQTLAVSLVLLAISTAMALFIYNTYHTTFSGSKANYSPYLLVIPSSLVGTFGIIFLSYSLRNRYFNHIGQMTMVILAFEEEVWIKIYKNVVAKAWYLSFEGAHAWNIEEISCALLGALFSVFLSVPLYYLFFRTPLCIIFNRRWKKKEEKQQPEEN